MRKNITLNYIIKVYLCIFKIKYAHKTLGKIFQIFEVFNIKIWAIFFLMNSKFSLRVYIIYDLDIFGTSS